MKEFRIDKAKNMCLLLVLIFLGIIFIVFVWLLDLSLGNKIFISFILFIGDGYCIFRISTDFTALIQINDNGIFYRRYGKEEQVPWKEIKRLEYKGTKRIPISELMIIHATYSTIYVDYNFKDYTTVWRDIVAKCEVHQPDFLMDIMLKERL